jgi:hypothetical protein
MLHGAALPSAPSSERCTPESRVALSIKHLNYRGAVGGSVLGWRGLHGRGVERYSAWLNGSHNGRHCGSPRCGDAAQSRVAERTVMRDLHNVSARDPGLRAAELS